MSRSPPIFGGMCCSSSQFSVLCLLFCLSSSCVLCIQCCLCVLIVHSCLPLLFSLAFIQYKVLQCFITNVHVLLLLFFIYLRIMVFNAISISDDVRIVQQSHNGWHQWSRNYQPFRSIRVYPLQFTTFDYLFGICNFSYN